MAKRKRKEGYIIEGQPVTKKLRLDDTKEVTIRPAYSVEEFFYNPDKIFCYNPSAYKSLDLFGQKLREEAVNLLVSGIKISDIISNISMEQVTIESQPLQKLLYNMLQCKTVTYLSLKGVRLHEQDVETLSKALEENDTLKAIILDGTTINDQKISKIVDALKQNNSLSHISLNNNMMTTKGIELLEKCIKNRSNFKLSTAQQFNVDNVGENEENACMLGDNYEQIDDL